jgi:hypothetical protein
MVSRDGRPASPPPGGRSFACSRFFDFFSGDMPSSAEALRGPLNFFGGMA